MKNRAALKDTTAGTGPYTLKEAVPGDHYTYAVRKDYAWGPNGAKTSAQGTPATIEVKIVSNETTAANELISGQINAASILGPDAARLTAAKVDAKSTELLIGEQWYNHGAGHATSDTTVRTALTQALNLAELQKVITSNTGAPAKGLAVLAPTGCVGDSVTGNVPANDTSGAAAALQGAGWAKAAWTDLGVDVKAKGASTTDLQPILFGTGAWDIAWEPINVSTPDQVVPFYSGAGLKEGGMNFASIQNPGYSSSVQTAMTKTGAEGCPDWQAAEASLFKSADVVPFANNVLQTFHKGADFDISGWIEPTSIRMLG
jgi:peptide/nickel transport system substrate-binding protein